MVKRSATSTGLRTAVMRMAVCATILWGLIVYLPAQRLPTVEIKKLRTLKFYPLNVLRGELGFGYEHGQNLNWSLSFQASYFWTGTYSQLSNQSSMFGEGCQSAWPVQGFGLKGGARYYPSKTRRAAPFYVEWLLAYRRLSYPRIAEYLGQECNPGYVPQKEIKPLVQRIGLHTLLGAAMRRDKRFTLDMYGGLGLNVIMTDERQPSDPGLPDDFFRPEPVRSRFSPSLHLGLSLGWNFHGGRRG